jgi:predicted nucleic acid-binding protein
VIRNVLLDTGPLLAVIDRRDAHHAWVDSQLAEIRPPLLTCEAVLTEACYLARRIDVGPAPVLELLERGVVRLAFDLDEQFAAVSSLMQRYTNVPMALADACLVRMSELAADCVLLTLDSNFRSYRRNRRQRIPLLIPEEL